MPNSGMLASVMGSKDASRKTSFSKDTMKALTRLALAGLLILVTNSLPVHAQSEADAVGSSAAPTASTTSVRRAAPKYADPSIGLELEYKVDNAEVCVIWPKRLRDPACEGPEFRKLVAYAAANAAVRGSLLRSMALLRYDNSPAIVTVGHAPATKTHIVQKEIDDILDGVLWGFKDKGHTTAIMSGSTPGSPYDVLEVNGVDALRFEVKGDAPRGTLAYASSRAVGYVLLGKHGKILVMAVTDPQHIRDARVALESIVKTVRMPALEHSGFGWNVDYWFRYGVGVFLSIVLLAGFVWAIASVGRSQKKRSQRR